MTIQIVTIYKMRSVTRGMQTYPREFFYFSPMWKSKQFCLPVQVEVKYSLNHNRPDKYRIISERYRISERLLNI